MPTMHDHFEHAKNVLKQRKTRMQLEIDRLNKQLQQEVLKLNEQIRQIESIQATWRDVGENGVMEIAPSDTGERGGGAPITESILKYREETGVDGITAKDIKKYLTDKGYGGKWLYNSIYETLTRWTKEQPPRLYYYDGKFYFPCSHGNARKGCETCKTQSDQT